MAGAEFLSFSRAAARLGLTQPALSYQVASLERSQGVELFVRGRRAVRLSPAGLYLHDQLGRLCADYGRMVAELLGAPAPEVCMNLRQLRAFLSVAATQSFTRAGDLSNLTRPAISHQIRSLEGSLGKPLFTRGHHAITLTEPGRVFAERVRGLLDDWGQVQLRVRTIGTGEGQVLTIGFLDGVLVQTLPGLVRSFARVCPKVRVETMHVSLAHMLDAILSGEIDCGFAPAFEGICPDGIQSQVVLRDRMVALVSVEHPFARRESLKLAQLKGQPLLSLSEKVGGMGVQWHRALCERYGLSCSLIEYSPDFASLFVSIGMGRGVAIQPGHILQEHGHAGIRAVPLEDGGLDIEFVVAWRAEGSNPVLPVFLQGFVQD